MKLRMFFFVCLAKDKPFLLFGHYVMGCKVRKPPIILFL